MSLSKRAMTMKYRPGPRTKKCVYCGGSGCRTQVVGGWTHKRCLPIIPKEYRRPVSGQENK